MATIQDITVKEVEKRKLPTKHYAYLIEVHWSDGRISSIGRRYSAFFDFQMSLLDKFPTEAGQHDPAQRVIPFLPGKSLFRFTNARAFAMKRMEGISEYCTGIAKMPGYMSGSDIVLEFFKPSADDRALRRSSNSSPEKQERKNTANEITGPLVLDKFVAIAEYKKENRKELSLKEGEVVEVVNKSENGWWLAANEEGTNGWVPAVYLESLYAVDQSPSSARAKPGEGEMYETITDYTANTDDELSFLEDDLLEVLEKNLEGWWYARKDNAEGWVPATYLQKSTAVSPTRASQANNQFGKFAAHQKSLDKAKKPPPKRGTVRRTLTKAAEAKVQADFRSKMIKQESIDGEEDDEFAGVYTTIGSFDSTIPDGLSFSREEKVHVIQKSNEGWWYGRIGDKRGWVPETYLTEMDHPVAPKPSSPVKKIQLPAKTPLEEKPRFAESPKKLLGFNGAAQKNTGSKSPKPPRPPSPKVEQIGRRFGTALSPVSPQVKLEARNPISPLPSVPQQKGKSSQFILANKPPSVKKKNLAEYNWYRDVSRQEAEDGLLCEGQEGYFIIRPSQRGTKQGKPYSLTLYHQNQNWNFHIRLRSDRMYAVGILKEAEACFSTIPELVEYYMEHPLVIGEEERKVTLVDSPEELYAAC